MNEVKHILEQAHISNILDAQKYPNAVKPSNMGIELATNAILKIFLRL